MRFQYEPGRIYAENTSGDLLAEIVFPYCGGAATIKHTFVDPSLRGQGIADKLVSAAVGQIRADGLKLEAKCPYAIKWLDEHPEQAGLP